MVLTGSIKYLHSANSAIHLNTGCNKVQLVHVLQIRTSVVMSVSGQWMHLDNETHCLLAAIKVVHSPNRENKQVLSCCYVKQQNLFIPEIRFGWRTCLFWSFCSWEHWETHRCTGVPWRHDRATCHHKGIVFIVAKLSCWQAGIPSFCMFLLHIYRQ